MVERSKRCAQSLRCNRQDTRDTRQRNIEVLRSVVMSQTQEEECQTVCARAKVAREATGAYATLVGYSYHELRYGALGSSPTCPSAPPL